MEKRTLLDSTSLRMTAHCFKVLLDTVLQHFTKVHRIRSINTGKDNGESIFSVVFTSVY